MSNALGKSWGCLAALVLALALFKSIARADDRAAALAVIDRAIEAHGGAEKLAKTRLLSRTAQGTLFGPENAFATEAVMQLPERSRDVIDLKTGREKTRLIFVIDGNKGWQSTGGAAVEIDKERLAELQEELYVLWLTTLTPLKDKSFTLSPLPETKIDGRPAGGVAVGREGRPPVKLYFDKASGLLVKLERSARQAALTVNKEYFFSDHKGFDGVKLPTKHVEKINGAKAAELAISTYQFPDKIEEGKFSKP